MRMVYRVTYHMIVLGCLLALGCGDPLLKPTTTPTALPVSVVEEPAEPEVVPLIRLSEQQRDAMRLSTVVVENRSMEKTRSVTGKLDYDKRRHVVVRSSVSGTVTEVFVMPGDQVRAGDQLVRINSPDLSSMKAHRLHAKAEVARAESLLKRDQEVVNAIKHIVRKIEESAPTDVVTQVARDSNLGSYRESLIKTYLEGRLAKQVLANLQETTTNVVPQRVLQEQLIKVDAANAAIQGTVEQAIFDSQQKLQQSLAALDEAKALLASQETAWQGLRGFMIKDDRKEPTSSPDESIKSVASSNALNVDEDSELVMIAPRDGMVVAQKVSAGERVENRDILFEIGDTRRLWAVGDVRQQDWELLSIKPGVELSISSPAIPQSHYSGKVLFLGAQVASDTQAVPIVIELEATDHRIRPGLFVRIAVPMSDTKTSVAVPKSALMDHDGKWYVFLAISEDSFRPSEVTIGIETEGWVEVLQGINAGDRIVADQTFLLKSLWLLESEEE